jgi:RNA recognition motif-containing protein
VTAAVRIYLGNLPPDVTAGDVRELFAAHVAVDRADQVVDMVVDLIVDQDTGAPRGFGFVTMDGPAAARAIAELDGFSWRGQTLRVNESHDRGARPPRRSW